MKKALIWGINGGIGQAICQELSHEGWTIIGATRDEPNIQINLDHLIQANFSSPNEVYQGIESIPGDLTPFDLWVYAAGDILYEKASAMKHPNWMRILDSNLNAAFITYQSSLAFLAPDAHIFFLGAVSERMRLPGLSAYAAAKSGLEAFVGTIAKEDRKRKYTVVRPGAVDTPFWDKVPYKLPTHSAKPNKVAQKILEAYKEGKRGILDLV